MRRWLVAAILLALIAIGVAAFALFTGDIDDTEASAADVTELSERVTELESRTQDATDLQEERAGEIDRLTTRVGELEQSVSTLRSETRQPSEEIRSLSNQVDDLSTRVGQLESEADGGPGGGAGGAGGAP